MSQAAMSQAAMSQAAMMSPHDKQMSPSVRASPQSKYHCSIAASPQTPYGCCLHVL